MNTKDADWGVWEDDDGGGIGWRVETSAETVIEDPAAPAPGFAPDMDDDWERGWGLRVAMVMPPCGVSLRHWRVLRTGK